jgi:uncharacterized membrane protein
MTLLLAFLIGLFAGLRSLTPPAAVAWAVYLGWLTLARPLSLIGSLPAAIILSVLAIAELIVKTRIGMVSLAHGNDLRECGI